MTQVLFDTQSAVDDLKRGGFSEEQAKANVRFVREALEGGVATKADIATVRTDVEKAEIALRGGMSTLRAEMRVVRFQILAALAGATDVLGALRLFT